MKIYVPLVLILFSLTELGGQDFQKDKDYAVFFAVNDYMDDNSWSDLNNPIRDAEAIADLLNQFYDFETYIYRDVKIIEIEDILADWQHKQFDENSQLFIFFSGHGYFNDFNKNGYFVPRDGQGNQYRTFLPLSDIGNIVTQIPCNHILLTIDACFSGTIDRKIAFKSGPPFNRPGFNENIFVTNFIEKALLFKSRLLVTSGQKERTPDGVNHSPLVESILEGLRNSLTDNSFRGLYTYQDLLADLSRTTPTPFHGELEGHENGGFVFISKDYEDFHVSNRIDSTSPIVDRKGNVYSTKRMADGKIWMTENLRIDIDGSYCYEDISIDCQNYGRHYTWEAAKDGCKELGVDWRLPEEHEFIELCRAYGVKFVGTSKELGESENAKILTSSGSSGFNLFLNERGASSSGEFFTTYDTRFWTNSYDANLSPSPFGFDINGFGRCHGESSTNAYAVRCIKD